MGDWGGAPEGWVPPEERKEREAAAEAAAAMEARRAQADARASALAGAVRDGLGMVAAAIMVASDHPAGFALERFEDIWRGLEDPDGSTMAPPDDGETHYIDLDIVPVDYRAWAQAAWTGPGHYVMRSRVEGYHREVNAFCRDIDELERHARQNAVYEGDNPVVDAEVVEDDPEVDDLITPE